MEVENNRWTSCTEKFVEMGGGAKIDVDRNSRDEEVCFSYWRPVISWIRPTELFQVL